MQRKYRTHERICFKTIIMRIALLQPLRTPTPITHRHQSRMHKEMRDVYVSVKQRVCMLKKWYFVSSDWTVRMRCYEYVCLYLCILRPIRNLYINGTQSKCIHSRPARVCGINNIRSVLHVYGSVLRVLVCIQHAESRRYRNTLAPLIHSFNPCFVHDTQTHIHARANTEYWALDGCDSFANRGTKNVSSSLWPWQEQTNSNFSTPVNVAKVQPLFLVRSQQISNTRRQQQKSSILFTFCDASIVFEIDQFQHTQKKNAKTKEINSIKSKIVNFINSGT